MTPPGSNGGRARWRILYAAMADLQPGELLTHERMGDLLGLDHHDYKIPILQAARRAADEHFCRDRVFRIAYGRGYERLDNGDDQPGPDAQSAGRPPSTDRDAVGEKTRWRVLYDAMAVLAPGDVLSFERMGELVHLDPNRRSDRCQLRHAARQAAAEHLDLGKAFRIVHGQGYELFETIVGRRARGWRPRRPTRSRMARWRTLYDAMAALAPGALLTFQRMGELLDLDPDQARDRHMIAAAARRAATEQLDRDKRVVRLVKGHGYELVQPDQVLEIARDRQAAASSCGAVTTTADADVAGAPDISPVASRSTPFSRTSSPRRPAHAWAPH